MKNLTVGLLWILAGILSLGALVQYDLKEYKIDYGLAAAIVCSGPLGTVVVSGILLEQRCLANCK